MRKPSSDPISFYDTRNQRIYSGPQTVGCGSTELYFFYGVDGKKLDVITAEHSTSGTCGVTVAPVTQTNVWFAGRLLVPQDRLNSHGKYFPYGEDRTNPSPANPANGVEKFATYTRDAESGLDYAYQRYYTSGLGRFLTPDRKGSSAKSYLPQTWNRYPYAGGDPANNNDPSGLDCGGAENQTGDCTAPGGEDGGDGPGDCFVGEDGYLLEPDGSLCDANQFVDDPTPSSTGTTQQPSCEDQLTSTIFDFLSSRSSPLAGWAADFVADAANAGLNPFLLVAISNGESTYGKSLSSQRTANAFGLMHSVTVANRRTHAVTSKSVMNNYDGDWGAGIAAAASAVDQQFVIGNVTVSLMFSGAPGAYCFGSCAADVANVSSSFVQLGSLNGQALNPNNPLDLLWPCKD